MKNKLQWWAYLHSNNKIIVKRWFGDVRDYTEDCENNPFVIQVVAPFFAKNGEEAYDIAHNKLGFVSKCNKDCGNCKCK